MRLERVYLDRFRRFVDESFYVNRKLVALVGANESGKSSVLTALQQFRTTAPVSKADLPRTISPVPTDGDSVRIVFRLEKADLAALRELPLKGKPATLTLTKDINGNVYWDVQPPLEFADRIARLLRAALPNVKSALHAVRNSDVDELEQPTIDQLVSLLEGDAIEESSIGSLSVQQVGSLRSLREFARERRAESKSDEAAWNSLEEYLVEIYDQPSLFDRAIATLTPLKPDFVVFDRDLRDLKDDYDLEPMLDASAPIEAPLGNLFEFAGITIEDIRGVIDDRPRQKNFLRDVNVVLRNRFKERWAQSDAYVRLDIEDRRLFVYVEDAKTSFLAAVSERSDGLRMFVALAFFLGSRVMTTPPIVLIDEADLHLHIDAQADLVRMLQGFKAIGQVIYTTHSPACLPGDLGTGVRLVARTESDSRTSTIYGSFWSTKKASEVGFSPFLYVLGARVASFSRLRSAALTEGDTEPFLMPALIRSAHGSDLYEFPFQFVGGLSSASDEGLAELRDVAVNVCAVVDGDSGGTELAERVERVLGLPADSVLHFPSDFAIEDLLDRTFYLACYNKVSKYAVSEDDLKSGVPIKTAIEQLHKARKESRVGPVVVAEMMLTEIEASASLLPLAEGAREILLQLERDIARSVMSAT